MRPARVPLQKEDAVDPPAVSSIARLPARTKTAGKSTKRNGERRHGISGGGEGDGVAAAGSDPPAECRGREKTVAPDDSSLFEQQQQQQHEEEENRSRDSGEAAEASACASSGSGGGDHNHGSEHAAAATGERWVGEEDGGACAGVLTPTRPALVVREELEEEPGSPPTPASPGLADWEITKVRSGLVHLPLKAVSCLPPSRRKRRNVSGK